MAWLWDGVEDQDQAQHQSQRQPTALSAPHEQRKRPRSFLNVAFIYAGNYLLSHKLSRVVPSAQPGLTYGFGMGTGRPPPAKSTTTGNRIPSTDRPQQIWAPATPTSDLPPTCRL